MLPVEHMDRLYTTLKAKQGQVTMVKLHAGHMDAYETAAQVTLDTLVPSWCQQKHRPQMKLALIPLHMPLRYNPDALVGCQ